MSQQNDFKIFLSLSDIDRNGFLMKRSFMTILLSLYEALVTVTFGGKVQVQTLSKQHSTLLLIRNQKVGRNRLL